MNQASDRLNGAGSAAGHSARDYGRAAEPLPDLHVFSRLSELDEAYAEELARARARQETLEREIAELSKRLTSPLEGHAALAVEPEAPKRGWFGSASSKRA